MQNIEEFLDWSIEVDEKLKEFKGRINRLENQLEILFRKLKSAGILPE